MKIVSWNVNGIRAVIKKDFHGYAISENPDIFCVQEIKAEKEQVELNLPQYPYVYWNSAEKKGYSGTMILSKIEPISVINGIGIEKHDKEGRVISLEFDKFFLVTIYVPNSKRELERLDYRQKEWDVDLLKYLKTLEKRKPVIFCGDLNVAHKEIDLANPKTNRHNAGFTDEEREGFDKIMESGFIDTFREFEKGAGHYTWWSYMGHAREKNVGWRIDYFCISPELRPFLQKSYIRPDISGSDHCPVAIEINL